MPPLIVLLTLNIALTIGAHTLLRNGMRVIAAQATGSGWSLPTLVWRVGTNPYVFGGMAAFGGSLVLWLYLVSKMKISVLYPIQQSLIFIGLQVIAWRWLGEGMTATKAVGVAVILAGVYLVARG